MTVLRDMVGAIGSRTKVSRDVRLARRRALVRAVLLLAPSLLFLGTFFVYPMIGMLTGSFHDESASSVFPRTASALGTWDGAELPGRGDDGDVPRGSFDGRASRTAPHLRLRSGA